MTKRVLIIGGYGNFGGYIAQKLMSEQGLKLIIAGRSEDKCRAFVDAHKTAVNPLQWCVLDITKDLTATLQDIKPDIVIHTSGPFQSQGYDVAETCIAQGCHYIDLADGREFVCSIDALDESAKTADVSVITGASSVPGLTSAIIDHYLSDFGVLHTVEYAISTAQQIPPGVATTAAILGYTGKPIRTLIDGAHKTVHGWQNLHSHIFPILGRRWLGNCDIPDLSLFPERYKDLRTLRFYAGAEVSVVHLVLWGLSWLVRAGMIKRLDKAAAILRNTGKTFDAFGSKTSGFFMRLSGTDKNEQDIEKLYYIIARSGHGPYIPCIPAILLTKKLANGTLQKPGAYACMGIISLKEYISALDDMDIQIIKKDMKQ
ncbi:MAG: saccharopine dehydrogenase NADP-binding domain-containing protein [Alphaproteobacteria bacterium]|nr:saccharopine dehydrogenase NADP-binding domain-containing protein [Alphaproteobacteria bacterium]